MPGKIPDRWLNYKALGNIIKNTRFITFKVPLDSTFDTKLTEEERFTPTMLMDQLGKQGLKLGVIVDLTNTKRYYRREEFEDSNIQYEKIFTEGHVVPKREVCNRFFNIVDSFLSETPNKDILIGIHCTHGLNRTGYLTCRYMVDKLGFSPDDAVKEFNIARGYGMERENYIEALKYPIGEYKESDEQTNNSESRFSRGWNRHHNGHKQPNGRGKHYTDGEGQSYRTTSTFWNTRYNRPRDLTNNYNRAYEEYMGYNPDKSYETYNPDEDTHYSGYNPGQDTRYSDYRPDQDSSYVGYKAERNSSYSRYNRDPDINYRGHNPNQDALYRGYDPGQATHYSNYNPHQHAHYSGYTPYQHNNYSGCNQDQYTSPRDYEQPQQGYGYNSNPSRGSQPYSQRSNKSLKMNGQSHSLAQHRNNEYSKPQAVTNWKNHSKGMHH